MKIDVLKSFDSVEMMVKNIVLFGSEVAEYPCCEDNFSSRTIIHKDSVRIRKRRKME